MPTANPAVPLSDEHRLLASAVGGDADAVEKAARAVEPSVLERHRLLPAIGRMARARGIEGPAATAWTRKRMGAAARWMHLEQEMETAGARLAAAGVAWMPIKGLDLARRVYEVEEDRPTSDVDLLIAPAGFDAAREALEEAGWSSRTRGPRVERYRREEGYAWQATRPGGPLLELHFRLWGLVSEGYADAVLESAEIDPQLTGGRRPALADAYLLAAVHHWLTARPRALFGWWDLERIAATAGARGIDLAPAVTRRARDWDLQAQVGLAAASAGALWPQTAAHADIAAALIADFRLPERRLLRAIRRGGPDAVGLRALVLARLLAGRASRSGWKVVPRQLWAHPGVVAQETPEHWPWPRRRAIHVGRQLGLTRR